jgi:RecA-family ATPase
VTIPTTIALSDQRKAGATETFMCRTLEFQITTMSTDEISRQPKRKQCIAGYFPVHGTTALVAMGGVGKTTWLTRVLLDELDRDQSLEAMIVSAEDSPDDYQSKIHNSLFTKDREGKAYHSVDVEKIAGRMHILNLKGKGAKLVADRDGSFVPSDLADHLLELIQEDYPKVRILLFETVSRFAGGETNERFEALVTACDRLAMGINGAVVLVHHTGKSQAREKITDLYSGRGGSALGDNTRSFVVLTQFDRDYMNSYPVRVSLDDVDAGRVFEVRHVRYSYGPTQEPLYYVTRAGCSHGPVLEQIQAMSQADLQKARMKAIEAAEAAAVTRIFNSIKVKGGAVEKKYFDKHTKLIIGVTQGRGRELIAELLEAGTLIEYEQLRKRAKVKMLKAGEVDGA